MYNDDQYLIVVICFNNYNSLILYVEYKIIYMINTFILFLCILVCLIIYEYYILYNYKLNHLKQFEVRNLGVSNLKIKSILSARAQNVKNKSVHWDDTLYYI